MGGGGFFEGEGFFFLGDEFGYWGGVDDGWVVEVDYVEVFFFWFDCDEFYVWDVKCWDGILCYFVEYKGLKIFFEWRFSFCIDIC